MGWNAWNTFSSNGRPLRGGRKEYQTVVDSMVAAGMVKAGYNVISTVCTDWVGRDPATHRLMENTTLWPGGMRDFADYLHSRGMLLSLYTDAGAGSCCPGEPGSLGHEALDMATFASWGADAVAVDYCGGPPDVEAEYSRFAEGIAASGRDMQLLIFNLGRGDAYEWAPAMSHNLTARTAVGGRRGSYVPTLRLTPDIGNVFDGRVGPTLSILSTLDAIQGIPGLWDHGMGAGSGTFPNYGQLAVGVPPNHPTVGDPGLSLVEAQAHFSLWAMLGSILLATNDVRERNASIERILLNPEVIAVNQDPLGRPGLPLLVPGCSGEAWAKELASGDAAVLLFNRQQQPIVMRLPLAAVPNWAPGAHFAVRDLQARRTLATACSNMTFALAPHETALVRLSRTSAPCDAPSGAVCTPAAPPCPAGYTAHASGFWANYARVPASKSVPQCAALCSATRECLAFEVFEPHGASTCYTFDGTLAPPFTPDNRIHTCVKG